MRFNLGRPLPYQWDFLDATLMRRLFLAGIGSGKTRILVQLAFREACMQPGVAGALLAPDFKLFKRVTLPAWREIVPKEAYRWRAADQEIHLYNGTVIYCMGCDKAEDRVVGMNLGWAGMDEAGAARNDRIPGLLIQRIRIGDPARRFLAMVTSPHGHGWLKEWSEKRDEKGMPAVHITRATTYDNPHLSEEYIRNLEIEFPKGTLLYEQELLGKFVALTGFVYGNIFDRERHMVDVSFDATRPYDLGWDPGSRASGVIAFQRFHGRHVAVMEWTDDGEFTEDTARRIKSETGKSPRHVYLDTPSKLNTRAKIDDAKALRAIFGLGCKVVVVGGRLRSSDRRFRSVSYGLSSGALAFSRKLLDERSNNRGIVKALEMLQWPDESTRVEKQDEKNRLKHIVDALEFYSVKNIVPRYGNSIDRAKMREAA